MSIGWHHFSSIQDTYRMIYREAIGIRDSMIIEGPYVHDEVGDWKPLSILLSVEEPGARLNVNIDDQIENQLEQPQR
jgi:hypothetical protein